MRPVDAVATPMVPPRGIPSGASLMRRAKSRRRLRRLLFGAAAVMLAVAGTGWLALRHIPDWYQPVQVPEGRLQQVRDSLTDKFSEISAEMVAGATFEVFLTDQTVTEWVAARGAIWPEADRWLPSWLTDPVVAFTPGRVVLGVHLNHDGWESIIGAHLAVGVEGQDLVLRLEGVTAGALPVPLSTLAKPLDRLTHADRLDIDALPDELAEAVRTLRRHGALSTLARGHRGRGPFVWKNGDRPYRLRQVQIGDGWLKAVIEPL